MAYFIIQHEEIQFFNNSFNILAWGKKLKNKKHASCSQSIDVEVIGKF